MAGRINRAIQVSVQRDGLKPILAGQCVFDLLGLGTQNHTNKLHLNYNKMAGNVLLTVDRQVLEGGWRTYSQLPFEHSDTCQSRQFRIDQERGQWHGKLGQPMGMAVCAYIMDRNKNLMITKRPEHQKIFPNVWVIPGGIVEYQESLETALFRELELEVGLTFEHVIEDDLQSPVRMISPLRFDHPTDEIAVNFQPFYLYESVTTNVLDEVEHLSGWQDRVRDSEEQSQN